MESSTGIPFFKYSISRNTGFGTSSYSSGDFWACFCGWWQSPLATPKSLPSVTGSPLVLALALIEQAGVPTCSIANCGRPGVFGQGLGVGGPAQLRPASASYCRGSERKVLRACMALCPFLTVTQCHKSTGVRISISGVTGSTEHHRWGKAKQNFRGKYLKI